MAGGGSQQEPLKASGPGHAALLRSQRMVLPKDLYDGYHVTMVVKEHAHMRHVKKCSVSRTWVICAKGQETEVGQNCERRGDQYRFSLVGNGNL